MNLSDLIAPGAIIPALKTKSKTKVLQIVAEKAAELESVCEQQVFNTILQREKLGSTGVGNGVAIPHGQLEEIGKIFGVFARLEHPVDFNAIDDQPVDLVFLLLAPENAGADHLNALSRIARFFRDPSFVKKLRHAQEIQTLYLFLTRSSSLTLL
jgi:PTS system nitrogen regulatory IIA component